MNAPREKKKRQNLAHTDPRKTRMTTSGGHEVGFSFAGTMPLGFSVTGP